MSVILEKLASKILFPLEKENVGKRRTGRDCRCEAPTSRWLHFSGFILPVLYVYISHRWVSVFHNCCLTDTVTFLMPEIPSLALSNLCEQDDGGPRLWNSVTSKTDEVKTAAAASVHRSRYTFWFLEHISARKGHRPEQNSQLKLGEGMKTKGNKVDATHRMVDLKIPARKPNKVKNQDKNSWYNSESSVRKQAPKWMVLLRSFFIF